MLVSCHNCGAGNKYTPAMLCRCGECGYCLEEEGHREATEAINAINQHQFYDPCIRQAPLIYRGKFRIPHTKKTWQERNRSELCRIVNQRAQEAPFKESLKRRNSKAETEYMLNIQREASRHYYYKWIKPDGTVKIVRSSVELVVGTRAQMAPYTNMKLVITNP